MIRRTGRLVGLACIVPALWAAKCENAPTAASAACETDGHLVTTAINAQRAQEGLGVLTVDVRLVAAAHGHSSDMASNGFVGHESADGSNAGQRIERSGYDWSSYSENVAAGQPTPTDVVAAWMSSPGHRTNILASDVEHLGVGYVEQSGTEYGHYWTVNFGATPGEVESPPDGCHP